MKMKRKILAILTVLMFLLIPISFAQASNTNELQTNDTIPIEIATFNEDESFASEIFTLTEEELNDFENVLSKLVDRIQSGEDLDETISFLDNFFDQQGIIKSIITRLLTSLKLLRYRGFVISLGHCFKLNPFKKNSFNIRQKFKFWLYLNDGNKDDRTIIFKPFSLKFDILRGRQFGRMSNFFGIYIYIAKRFPEKSTTFFMGTARSINGRQFFSFR